jgi:hypothetical protein
MVARISRISRIALVLAVLLVPGAAVAGRIGGPQRHLDSVNARSNDWYRIPFHGNEQATIVISGDGSTDLDCWVYDENGNQVDSDTDSTDKCWLTWTPAWSGVFKVKISNFGYISNVYVMQTN